MSKYDKMIEENQRKSKEKIELALQAIQDMLANKERISVPKLMKKTGLSRGFFYKNPTVRDTLNQAVEQQAGMIDPRREILNMAMEKQIELLNQKVAALTRENKELKRKNEKLQKALWKQDLKQYDDAKTDYTTAIEKAVEQPYTRAEAYVGRAEVNEVTNANEAALSDYESAQNILDSIDWSKFKEITEQMLKALQEKIEKACEELRALLGLNENDEPLDTTAIFQNAIDGVAADAEYAENERYVIVNDYDGDGKQEAFGFLGIRNDEYQTWESVKLYYLKSDGSVEKIALNGDVTGGPAKVSGTEQMDFSESFITLGNKTFLDFEIGYSASEPTTVLFGVNDGNYTSTSVYGYFPEKVDENHIATSDLDYRVVYKEENGIFTETMRMPGEDYEYRFASKEEYLNSMLTEEQLKDMARGLGVPEDLDVRYIQGERSYWEAGECWEIYVLVCTGNKCIASCSINPDNGEWTRNTAMYDPDHAWEVNC